MVSVVVRGRIPGRAELGDVLLEVASPVTARDLIAAAVTAQLTGSGSDPGLHLGPGSGPAPGEGSLWADYSRLYLTDQEITAMAAHGVVRLETPEDVRSTVDAATAHAVEAFRRGLFVIFAGARRIETPDEAITLQNGDRVVFLRLTALVGG